MLFASLRSFVKRKVAPSRVLFLGAIVLTLLATPLYVAAFDFWGFLSVGDKIVDGLVVIIVTLTASIPALIFFVVAGLTNWIIGIVLDIGVTPGADGTPLFVEAGWTFTRNLTNVLLLLTLAFIGLATILRWRDFEFQKTLPALIGVALLVNFSGVLVGVVVDIANILTNFFLSATGSFSLARFESIYLISREALDKVNPGGDAALANVLLGGLAYGIAMAVFYTVSAVAFFTVFLLFFLRTIVLWVLVILAPLAFFSYILPSTRQFWNQWRSNLIQWALVGVPISFFMWLSKSVIKGESLFATSSLRITTSGTVGANGVDLASIVIAMLVPFAGVLILLIGVTLSMSLAPAGSQAVINWGRKAGLDVYKGAGKKAWQTTRDRIPEGARTTIKTMAAFKTPKLRGGIVGKAGAGILGYTTRAAGGLGKRVVIDSEEADAAKARAKAAGQDATSNLHDLRQSLSKAIQAGILDAMRQKNQLKDVLDPDVVGATNVLKPEEAVAGYAKAHQVRNSDLVEGLERAFLNKPEVLEEFARITDRTTQDAVDPHDRTGTAGRPSGLSRRDVEEKGYTSLADKIVGEAKTADEIKALQKNWENNDALMEAVLKFWKGSQVSQAVNTIGRSFVSRLEAAKQEKGADWYFELEEKRDASGRSTWAPRNTAIPQYLASSAAQGLGLSPIENLEERKDINTKTQEAWRAARERRGAGGAAPGRTPGGARTRPPEEEERGGPGESPRRPPGSRPPEEEERGGPT